jgi:heptosyltransferase-2
MRTLIIAPDTVRDAVMTQPLTVMLRRVASGAHITVLTVSDNASIFLAMSEVDEVIALSRPTGRLPLLEMNRIVRILRQHRFEQALVLHDSLQAAFIAWSAGIPTRRGLGKRSRLGLINRPHDTSRLFKLNLDLNLDLDPRRPLAERFAHLAFDSSKPLPVRLPNPSLSRRKDLDRSLMSQLGLTGGAPVLALCVGIEGQASRRWPARRWAALITLAADAWPGIELVLLGSTSDRGFATEVAALCGRRCRNLCGRHSLTESMAVLAQAEAVVTHDIEPMHLAAAYGRPMVAIFGPTDPRLNPPRSPLAKVEWLHHACSPCNQSQCRFGHGDCLSQISSEQVFDSLRRQLQSISRDIR